MNTSARWSRGQVLIACAVAALVAAPSTGVTQAGTITQRQVVQRDTSTTRYTDKVVDYGVCRGVDPSCYNNWGAAFRANATPRVLVISRTAGPRHGKLGTQMAEGLNPTLADNNVAQKALVAWGQEYGFQVDWTEDLSIITGRLKQYNVLVFLSNTRAFLDDASQTALMQYMRNGGGFVAIHNTLGAMYQWPYFQGLMGGANFYDHGPNRGGTVVMTNTTDESTRTLPARWAYRDEWYHLEPFPSFVRVLAEVDTDSFQASGQGGAGQGGPGGQAGAPGQGAQPAQPAVRNGHPGHPGFHPVTWCQYYDGGRAWITSLGHDAGSFRDDPAFPGQKEFKEHVVKGILSAAGVLPFCTG